MLACERLFGEVRGLEIQELVEDATGELCPCKAGRLCPLEVVQEERHLTVVAS